MRAWGNWCYQSENGSRGANREEGIRLKKIRRKRSAKEGEGVLGSIPADDNVWVMYAGASAGARAYAGIAFGQSSRCLASGRSGSGLREEK